MRWTDPNSIGGTSGDPVTALAPPALGLVVLRVGDLDAAAALYGALGLDFVRHRHGKGPVHLSAEHAGCVFELYPRGDGPSSEGTRVGFRVDDVAAAVEAVVAAGATLRRPPKRSAWGRRAVVRDLDGHAVEIFERRVSDADLDAFLAFARGLCTRTGMYVNPDHGAYQGVSSHFAAALHHSPMSPVGIPGGREAWNSFVAFHQGAPSNMVWDRTLRTTTADDEAAIRRLLELFEAFVEVYRTSSSARIVETYGRGRPPDPPGGPEEAFRRLYHAWMVGDVELVRAHALHPDVAAAACAPHPEGVGEQLDEAHQGMRIARRPGLTADEVGLLTGVIPGLVRAVRVDGVWRVDISGLYAHR